MKCGIEIHQRLATEHKLFCKCNAGMPLEKTSTEVVRILHPVASELGEMDVAASFEHSRSRQFRYLVKNSSACLVDVDSEPPNKLNKDALDIAIEISMLLNARIVDEIQVMRKTVIDGSNTSGFQRTMVVGVDGYIETSKGKVGIPTICLEEESAGIVEKKEKETVYSLDRLGIPLIEIATSPDIVDGEHAKEVAQKLGTILRITGKVQRGIGTIRQDVNISIPEGARVEIKGVQELSEIPLIVENEINRQKKLIEIKDQLSKRTLDTSINPILDLSDIFSSTESPLIKKQKSKVFGSKFKGLSGIFGIQLSENSRYGTELSYYAKIASGIGGIIHSDEDLKQKYNFSDDEIAKVKMRLNISKEEGFVLIVTDKIETASLAIRAIFERIKQTLVGVPEETRNALLNGETAYMRPLPGGARLYPETDTTPVKITNEYLERIKNELPKSVEEQRKELISLINNEQLAEALLLSTYLPIFRKIIKMNVDPKFVASTILNTFISLKRDGCDIESIPENQIIELFSFLEKGKITKTVFPEIIKEISQKKKTVEDAINENKWLKLSEESLTKIVESEIKDEDPNEAFKKLMAKYRLVVDPAELKQSIEKHIKK